MTIVLISLIATVSTGTILLVVCFALVVTMGCYALRFKQKYDKQIRREGDLTTQLLAEHENMIPEETSLQIDKSLFVVKFDELKNITSLGASLGGSGSTLIKATYHHEQVVVKLFAADILNEPLERERFNNELRIQA